MRALHLRLAAGFALLVVFLTLGLLATATWSADRYDSEVRQLLNHDVAAHVVDSVSPFVGAEPNHEALKALFMDVMVINPSLEVYLLDGEGKILAYDAPPGRVVRERVDLAPLRRFLEPDAPRHLLGDDPRDARGRKPFSAAPVLDGGVQRGWVYIIVGGQRYDSIAALLRNSHVARVFLAAAVGIALWTLLVGLVGLSRLTRPLRRLRAHLAAFREDRSYRPLAPKGSDELAELGRTFDHLAKRVVECVSDLERVDRERREFIAGVSHDLRTPLAAIEGALEVLAEKPGLAPDERRRILDAATRRARQLAHLIEQLFELARLEAGDIPLEQEDFSAAELVVDVLRAHGPAASRRGVHLACRLPRELPSVHGDIRLVERALDNLLSNATLHTPSGGRVEVALRGGRHAVEVRVSDTGEGIAPEDVPRIFERNFHGSKKSRGGDGGTGLGLAITRRIIELHGEEIEVASRPGGGTTFRFTLPAGGRRDRISSAM